MFPSLDEVIGELRTISEDDTIEPGSRLATVDVDSLDILEWVYEIEERAGFQFDESLYDRDVLETRRWRSSTTVSGPRRRVESPHRDDPDVVHRAMLSRPTLIHEEAWPLDAPPWWRLGRAAGDYTPRWQPG